MKDGNGNVEIEPKYQRAEQTEDDKALGIVRLIAYDHVLSVSPDDWDLLAFSRRTNPYILAEAILTLSAMRARNSGGAITSAWPP